MSERPTRTIRKFNPGVFQSDQEVIDQFVVRTRELETVLEILRDNTGAPSCQHMLVVGSRGRGKTMLLARVAAELRTNAELRRTLLPVRFMEESLEVFDIGDFWLEALHYLAKECADHRGNLSLEIEATHADLARRTRGDDVAGHAKAALLDAADRTGRRLVLMVENLQSLSEEVDEDFGWQLRESLQTDPRSCFWGPATSRFESLDDAGAPFFELFRTIQLKPLCTTECRSLWQVITGEHRSAKQIRPLEIFTGGSPRLIVLVTEFARHRTMPELLEELVGLVDDHSEYFRGNLNSLPKTERRVYVALADLWRPSSTRDVANRARLGVRTTSALLGRLAPEARGAVRAEGSGGNRLYSVAEPLYCIYYKLRRLRDEAAIVHGLIRFMTALYGPDQTMKILGDDKTHHKVFLRAQKDLDPDLGDIPAESAAVTFRDLVERRRDLGDSERDIQVAGELLNLGVKLGNAGEAGRAIEYNDELIRHFESSPILEVQLSVARAFFNKALSMQRSGEHKYAVAAFNDVVTRFASSKVSDIQECVATALLNKGYLHGRLGEPEPAIASYNDAIERFANSPPAQTATLRSDGAAKQGLRSCRSRITRLDAQGDRNLGRPHRSVRCERRSGNPATGRQRLDEESGRADEDRQTPSGGHGLRRFRLPLPDERLPGPPAGGGHGTGTEGHNSESNEKRAESPRNVRGSGP